MKMFFEEMGTWERKKAIFLLGTAEDMGMETDGLRDLAVNPTNGYTYLWSVNYVFILYMPINCELLKADIWALYYDPEGGEDIERELKEDTTLKELEEWTRELWEERE